MECRWIFVIGIIVLNISKAKTDMIDPEPSVEADNKLAIENTRAKDKHDTSLFPKMIKKFVVTLAPPRFMPENRIASKRRLLPQFMLKQRVNDSPNNTKFILTRQPLMKRRKFTVKPRTLNLSTNTNNINRKNPILLNNQHKLRVINKITDIVTSTAPTHDKGSSEEQLLGSNKNAQKDTSKESNEMFQTDTFGVFSTAKPGVLIKESRSVKLLNEKEFDVSHEVNTLPSILSEENNSNESITKTNADEKNKKYNESRENISAETLKGDTVSTNNNDYMEEENADRNEFLFTGSHIRNIKAATNNKADATTTERSKKKLSSGRLERSVNVIEEEHSATASSFFHSTGRHSLLDLNYVYNNIHT